MEGPRGCSGYLPMNAYISRGRPMYGAFIARQSPVDVGIRYSMAPTQQRLKRLGFWAISVRADTPSFPARVVRIQE